MYKELKEYIEMQNERIDELNIKNQETLSWANDIEKDVEKMGVEDSKRCQEVVEVWIDQMRGWRESYEQDIREIERKIKEYGG